MHGPLRTNLSPLHLLSPCFALYLNRFSNDRGPLLVYLLSVRNPRRQVDEPDRRPLGGVILD